MGIAGIVPADISRIKWESIPALRVTVNPFDSVNVLNFASDFFKSGHVRICGFRA